MTFVLAHLSDAHLGPIARPRLKELAGKRLTGWLNWTRGRSTAHDMTLLATLVADLKAHHPSHIAVTGDLLNIGLPSEFPVAQSFLEDLGPAHDVSFTPGNHDAYVRSSLPQLAQTFAPWSRDDNGHSGYPYMRIRDDIAIIGTSSGFPTAPFLASGRLGEDQLTALGVKLDEARAKNLFRIVLIHHPPHREGASKARGLLDAKGFERIMARHGAELVLHGHNHRNSVSHVRGPDRKPIPVVGVGSASAAGGTLSHRASYHLFYINRTEEGFTIRGNTRGLTDTRRVISDLGALRL